MTSPRELPQDHFCPWREEAEELRTELDAVQQRLATIERHLFGKKSEKMPSLARELAKKPSRAETTKTRADRAAVKAKTPTEVVEHKVPDEERACPKCHWLSRSSRSYRKPPSTRGPRRRSLCNRRRPLRRAGPAPR